MLTKKVQCLPVNGVSMGVSRAERQRNVSPWSSGTLDLGYINEYMLFLLEPVKMWFSVTCNQNSPN